MKAITLILAALICLAALLPAGAGEGDGQVELNPLATDSGLTMALIDVPGNDFAYLETTVLGDMDSTFGRLAGLAREQGLITGETRFGSMYPTDMSQGIDDATPAYAGISLSEGMEISEPLKRGHILPGPYLTVQHWGAYDQLEQTYVKIYTWAGEHGVALGFPSFEVYMTDPQSTPVDMWLTLIYFPCDPAQVEPFITDADDAVAAWAKPPEPGVVKEALGQRVKERLFNLPEGMQAELVEVEPMAIAYMEGLLLGDAEAQFTALAEEGDKQGLLGADTEWGSVYPDDLSRGVDDSTRRFAGFTLPEGKRAAAPLKMGKVFGGTYLMVLHRGSYDTLKDTYAEVFKWAALNGMNLETPTVEHYVTDPEATPVEDWLTELYFPFDNAGIKKLKERREDRK